MVTKMASEIILFGMTFSPQAVAIGAISLILALLFRRMGLNNPAAKNSTNNGFDKEKTFDLIRSRRTIMPKEYVTDGKLTADEISLILEAANWAPTHQKTEPWRYVIISSKDTIEEYFDFLEDWYDTHDVGDNEMIKFKSKLESLRAQWPFRVSHMILLGMRRASIPEKRLPEWEEISAVAMSVQNMHLMATSLENVGAFWSSHTWCKAARDSEELRNAYFDHLLPDPDDRVFGALVLGKYPPGKQYRSTRTNISEKIIWK